MYCVYFSIIPFLAYYHNDVDPYNKIVLSSKVVFGLQIKGFLPFEENMISLAVIEWASLLNFT